MCKELWWKNELGGNNFGDIGKDIQKIKRYYCGPNYFIGGNIFYQLSSMEKMMRIFIILKLYYLINWWNLNVQGK